MVKIDNETWYILSKETINTPIILYKNDKLGERRKVILNKPAIVKLAGFKQKGLVIGLGGTLWFLRNESKNETWYNSIPSLGYNSKYDIGNYNADKLRYETSSYSSSYLVTEITEVDINFNEELNITEYESDFSNTYCYNFVPNPGQFQEALYSRTSSRKLNLFKSQKHPDCCGVNILYNFRFEDLDEETYEMFKDVYLKDVKNMLMYKCPNIIHLASYQTQSQDFVKSLGAKAIYSYKNPNSKRIITVYHLNIESTNVEQTMKSLWE